MGDLKVEGLTQGFAELVESFDNNNSSTGAFYSKDGDHYIDGTDENFESFVQEFNDDSYALKSAYSNGEYDRVTEVANFSVALRRYYFEVKREEKRIAKETDLREKNDDFDVDQREVEDELGKMLDGLGEDPIFTENKLDPEIAEASKGQIRNIYGIEMGTGGLSSDGPLFGTSSTTNNLGGLGTRGSGNGRVRVYYKTPYTQTVYSEDPTFEGKVDEDAVIRWFEEHLKEFRQSFIKEDVKKSYSLDGKVVVKLQIETNGRVTAEIESKRMLSEQPDRIRKTNEEILRRYNDLVLWELEDGPVTVWYPLVFRSKTDN